MLMLCVILFVLDLGKRPLTVGEEEEAGHSSSKRIVEKSKYFISCVEEC